MAYLGLIAASLLGSVSGVRLRLDLHKPLCGSDPSLVVDESLIDYRETQRMSSDCLRSSSFYLPGR